MCEISALIVDDSSVMRKIVERALRQAGLTITNVLRGFEWQSRRWRCCASIASI